LARGQAADFQALWADLQARDARDTARATAPLRPSADAQLLDNTDVGIEASVQQVLAWWEQKLTP
jgi:3-phosphoshikimate 1-carboxyvinyltransferase